MKNLLFAVVGLLIGGLIGFSLNSTTPLDSEDNDLESGIAAEIQALEDIEDGFSTQSASFADRYTRFKSVIDKIRLQNSKYEDRIVKYKNLIEKLENKIDANTTTRIPSFEQRISKLIGLYVCTTSGWEFDDSYTGCYDLSGDNAVAQGETTCYFADEAPSASDCAVQDTPTWTHCGDIYTTYDSYIDAYNTDPGCATIGSVEDYVYSVCNIGFAVTSYDAYLDVYSVSNAGQDCSVVHQSAGNTCTMSDGSTQGVVGGSGDCLSTSSTYDTTNVVNSSCGANEITCPNSGGTCYNASTVCCNNLGLAVSVDSGECLSDILEELF